LRPLAIYQWSSLDQVQFGALVASHNHNKEPGDGGNHARAEEGVTDVTTNTNNRGPTSEARPAQKRWVGWDEFQRLGPPNNVHADVAWSLFGPGRYASDVLPETRAFMRRHRLEGVKRLAAVAI